MNLPNEQHQKKTFTRRWMNLTNKKNDPTTYRNNGHHTP